ncbi:enoyl-CoA hydratase/isomerase family protein [Sorangium sp. Soce836]|uniref:Enoyl-CoA hydratase n=2 Tax=Sorangium cellulosum TaxID=56 RepID=A0A4P2QQK5_SORCE|nr:enoyl-CoA hydratase-related protein [Sorangium sp. Soce836]AUX32161.1 enoyl-CoA hydratase [Sorangium cellulosum]WCQ91531.1 Short-chain-enoyl-CoA hydratase [Sorangium sp. Soce836]
MYEREERACERAREQAAVESAGVPRYSNDMSEDVLLTERDGAVTVITLNRPKARNALDPALLKALPAALLAAGDDPEVRAIVLTGAGGAFCAGADLKAAVSSGVDLFEQLDGLVDVYHSMIRAIVGAPKPVIAMVDGGAVGFGCDLALACDMRVLSTEAYLQEKFVKMGLMPDGGGTFLLPRLVGIARAMELMLTGEPVNAERAVALGLANRAVPAASLREETMRLAHQLAKGPPIAFAEIKRSVREGFGGTIDGALKLEKAGQLKCLRSNDCLEGVAAWMQKREPEFKGK